MIKIALEFEIDEDILKEMFDDCEVKFTKKKGKELQEELESNTGDTEMELSEHFEEHVREWIENLFGE
jgi:hypothetical protein